MSDVEKMVAEMKRLAGYASDYPRHFAKVATPASEVIALIAEYERLKGIVDALPKMADGAIIQLGKPAWVQAVSGPLPRAIHGRSGPAGLEDVG